MNENIKNNKILSISSGGSYNILYLKIMKEYIEFNKLDNKLFLNEFNYFIGTSAGSLIILFLILDYSIQDIYEIFIGVINLFDNNLNSVKNLIKSFFNKPIYDIKIFKEKIIYYIKNSPLNEKFKNNYFKEITNINELNEDNFTLDLLYLIYPEKKFYFISFNLDLLKPIIFTNSNTFKNNNNFNQNLELKVLDCINMSSAAPLIFDDLIYNNYHYLDGGLSGLHNPAFLGYLIVKQESREKINLLSFDYKINFEIKKDNFIQLATNHTGLTKLLLNLSKIENILEIDIMIINKVSGFTNKILKYVNNIYSKTELLDKLNNFFLNIS